MFFSKPNNGDVNLYSFGAPSSSAAAASVDCTLSLATPSTRRYTEDEKRSERRRMANFCWDILPSPPPTPSKQHPPPPSVHKSAENIGPRRCANCDTTSTPLWRNGPHGPKSLCNACGIRFKKEERRASAAAVATANGGTGIEKQQHMINASWANHHHHHHYMNTQTQKMGYFSSAYGTNEFRFIGGDDDDRRDSDAGAIPFISWRSSLVHDFTR